MFDFFRAAENLQQLTPSFLDFKILTPTPIPVKKGTLIDYQIKLGPFPMRWRTLISEFDPPRSFVDDQLKGPYLKWHHEHTFEARDGGVVIRDKVTYRVPGWILEPVIHALFVAPQLKAIFDYRNETIRHMFGKQEAA